MRWKLFLIQNPGFKNICVKTQNPGTQNSCFQNPGTQISWFQNSGTQNCGIKNSGDQKNIKFENNTTNSDLQVKVLAEFEEELITLVNTIQFRQNTFTGHRISRMKKEKSEKFHHLIR